MIGGPFNQPFRAPQWQNALYAIDEAGATQPPPEPFVWGQGGARLTPDQIARRQDEISQQRAMGLDTSPVGHWTAGLARILNAVVARRDQGRLDRDITANRDAQSRMITSLSSGAAGGKPSAVAAALSSSDPVLQKLGFAQWERDNPKPANNDTVQDYNFRAQKLGQAAADKWLERGGDPFITATTPTGFFAGPQSDFAAFMGGGGQSAPVPSAPVGNLTPIDDGPPVAAPDPTSFDPAGFSPGQLDQIRGSLADPNVRAAFDKWRGGGAAVPVGSPFEGR